MEEYLFIYLFIISWIVLSNLCRQAMSHFIYGIPLGEKDKTWFRMHILLRIIILPLKPFVYLILLGSNYD